MVSIAVFNLINVLAIIDFLAQNISHKIPNDVVIRHIPISSKI